MRVIRNAVDATRRAIDDPTGAYTDLVAALESLADDDLTTPPAGTDSTAANARSSTRCSRGRTPAERSARPSSRLTGSD